MLDIWISAAARGFDCNRHSYMMAANDTVSISALLNGFLGRERARKKWYICVYWNAREQEMRSTEIIDV